jgi:hypothetical protein
MKITKEEVFEIVKKNGLNEEQGEQLLELLGKGIGGSIIDLIKLLAEKTENEIDDMIVMAGESKLREMVSNIQVNL